MPPISICPPVGLHEVVEGGDGLCAILGALQRSPDVRTIVHDGPFPVPKADPAERSLGDRQLMLIGIADDLVGVRRLGDAAEVCARVPVPDFSPSISVKNVVFE